MHVALGEDENNNAICTVSLGGRSDSYSSQFLLLSADMGRYVQVSPDFATMSFKWTNR